MSKKVSKTVANDFLQEMEIIKEIKLKIKISQQKAMFSVNKEMIVLYWNIGRIIYSRSEWGNKFIDNLSKEIKLEFPQAKGYSVRNLKNMLRFYCEYQDIEFVQSITAQITWTHNIELFRVKSIEERKWYIEKTIENGWSVDVLAHQINTNLYLRQLETKKISNFNKALDAKQSELALDTMKDPYIFDFINLSENIKEKDLELALVNNVTKLLLELGKGFAFLGHQYHIVIANEDFYIDLLFYNLNLRCYVVIELKIGEFKPEYVGQLNFYLTAVDETMKTELDKPTIGLLLCRCKNNIIAEYTLRDIAKPMGVSSYRINDYLPEEIKNHLPSIERIEKELKNE